MLDLLRFNFMKNSVPAQAVSQHQIMLDGVSVSYTLKRSPRRRSITLTVDENGLRVGAPWRSPETRIASMLEGHAHWITRKLAAWQARKPLPFTWETGAAIMVLGQPLTLLPAPARSNTTSDGVHLHVAAQADQPVMMAKQAVNRAYESPLSEGLAMERQLFHSLFSTEDQKEGMKAFVEKRKPVFKHR